MSKARFGRWTMGLFCALFLTACSEGADQTEQMAAPPVDPDSLQALQDEREAKRAESQGKELYEMVCASCHEGQVAKAPHRTMLEIMSPESIHASMVTGVMQENAAGLRDEEKVILSEYLAGKKMGGGDDVAKLMCETPAEEAFDYSRPPFSPGWGLNRNNQRLIDTQTAGLTPEDLPRLELKWAFAYPDALRARSAPMVAAGMIFVGSHDGTVFALDQKTGCVYWTFRASAEVRTGIVL
ncbi:MAG: PQQ-binding-like beta-propeller repeat protein, partial [Alphaproteobacteria bacterium]|nr:PQQ-binding-like beta-propeller repeat protein [Alphaproteobacteria bacterium]